jgi:putative spermidine/putrescine transport system substrate-binding protein
MKAAVLLLSIGVTAACANGGKSGGSGGLVFVGAGGSYQAAQQKAFLDPYTTSTGVKIQQDSPLSYPKLRAMVDAKNVTWDVMEGLPQFALANCGKYLEKIDYNVVDVSGVDKKLVSDCAVPDMRSAYMLVYNTKKYGANGPKSWADFFDTKKFPGKRGVMNMANQGNLEVALMADGVKPADIYPIDYNRAFRKLDSIRKDTVFLSTGAEQQQALATGRVDMMMAAWPGRAYDAEKQGASLTAVWNQPLLYWDVLVVPKGTKHKAEVMKFLNTVVSADAQTRLAESYAYAPINNASKPNYSPLQEKYIPHGQDNGTGFWRNENWWAQNLDDATAKWTKWAAG